MSDPALTEHRTIGFESLDGPMLAGDLALPRAARAGAVVCHPHPRYGGNRLNNVVSALYESLPASGIATLRFDFRAQFSDGVGERLDALAALDELTAVVGDVPVAMVGYSFGAWIALGLDDDRIDAIVAIAPPLAAMPATPVPTVPTLVLTPAHDQFSAPAASEAIIADWRSRGSAPIDHETIEMADHSLVGHTADVAGRTASWLSGRRRLPSPLSPRR